MVIHEWGLSVFIFSINACACFQEQIRHFNGDKSHKTIIKLTDRVFIKMAIRGVFSEELSKINIAPPVKIERPYECGFGKIYILIL